MKTAPFAAILLAGLCAAAEKPTSDPFAPFADLPAEELLPKGAGFTIAKDGSLLVAAGGNAPNETLSFPQDIDGVIDIAGLKRDQIGRASCRERVLPTV